MLDPFTGEVISDTETYIYIPPQVQSASNAETGEGDNGGGGGAAGGGGGDILAGPKAEEE
jgi:hypothetical protein